MASNLINLLKIVTEIKLNPRQKPPEVYSALDISSVGRGYHAEEVIPGIIKEPKNCHHFLP